jgi:hypothetical protein
VGKKDLAKKSHLVELEVISRSERLIKAVKEVSEIQKKTQFDTKKLYSKAKEVDSLKLEIDEIKLSLIKEQEELYKKEQEILDKMSSNERVKLKLSNDLANYEKLKSDLTMKVKNILTERKVFEKEVTSFRGFENERREELNLLEKRKFSEFEAAQKQLDRQSSEVEKKLESLKVERYNIEVLRAECDSEVKGWGLAEDGSDSDAGADPLTKSEVLGLPEGETLGASPGLEIKESDNAKATDEMKEKIMDKKIQLAARMNIYRKTQEDLASKLDEVDRRKLNVELKRDEMQEEIKVKSVRMIGHELNLKNVKKDAEKIENKSSVKALGQEMSGMTQKINSEKMGILQLKIDLVRDQEMDLLREEEILRSMVENNSVRVLVQKDWSFYWKALSVLIASGEVVSETRQFKKFEVDYKRLMAETEGSLGEVQARQARITKEKAIRMIEKLKLLDQREKCKKAVEDSEREVLEKGFNLKKKELELEEYKNSLERKIETFNSDQARLDSEKKSIQEFNLVLLEKLAALNKEMSSAESHLETSQDDLRKLKADFSIEKSAVILDTIRRQMAAKENSIVSQKKGLEGLRDQLMASEENLKMREAQLNASESAMKTKGDKIESDLTNYEDLKSSLQEKIKSFSKEKIEFKKDRDTFTKKRQEQSTAQEKERRTLEAESSRISKAKLELEKREIAVNSAKVDISTKINKFLEDKSELESRTRNLDAQKLAIKEKESTLDEQQKQQLGANHNIESERKRLKSFETSLQDEKRSLKKKESLLQSKVSDNENLGKSLAEQLNDYEDQKVTLKSELE